MAERDPYAGCGLGEGTHYYGCECHEARRNAEIARWREMCRELVAQWDGDPTDDRAHYIASSTFAKARAMLEEK